MGAEEGSAAAGGASTVVGVAVAVAVAVAGVAVAGVAVVGVAVAVAALAMADVGEDEGPEEGVEVVAGGGENVEELVKGGREGGRRREGGREGGRKGGRKPGCSVCLLDERRLTDGAASGCTAALAAAVARNKWHSLRGVLCRENTAVPGTRVL